MRFLCVLFWGFLASVSAYGQEAVTIVGQTHDCFAGKIIHPAKVDIYFLDPVRSSEVMAILNDMEKQMPHGNDTNLEAFFASYERLISAVRKTASLAHVRSNQDGNFKVDYLNLKLNTKIIVFGFAETEDDSVYYAYEPLTIHSGQNVATLDFYKGIPCHQ